MGIGAPGRTAPTMIRTRRFTFYRSQSQVTVIPRMPFSRSRGSPCTAPPGLRPALGAGTGQRPACLARLHVARLRWRARLPCDDHARLLGAFLGAWRHAGAVRVTVVAAGTFATAKPQTPRGRRPAAFQLAALPEFMPPSPGLSGRGQPRKTAATTAALPLWLRWQQSRKLALCRCSSQRQTSWTTAM